MSTLAELATAAYGDEVTKAWGDPVKRAAKRTAKQARRRDKQMYGWLGEKTHRASQGQADAWADRIETRLVPNALKTGMALGAGIGGGIAAGGTLAALSRRRILGRNEPKPDKRRR